MRVILKVEVKGKGKVGEVIEVSDGYGRNCLIAKGQAVEATKENLNTLKIEKQRQLKIEKEQLEQAQALKEKVEQLEVEVILKVGKDGKVFGALTSKEIVNAIKEQHNIEIDKKKVKLIEQFKFMEQGVSKDLNVEIKLHKDVTSVLKVKVTAI